MILAVTIMLLQFSVGTVSAAEPEIFDYSLNTEYSSVDLAEADFHCVNEHIDEKSQARIVASYTVWSDGNCNIPLFFGMVFVDQQLKMMMVQTYRDEQIENLQEDCGADIAALHQITANASAEILNQLRAGVFGEAEYKTLDYTVQRLYFDQENATFVENIAFTELEQYTVLLHELDDNNQFSLAVYDRRIEPGMQLFPALLSMNWMSDNCREVFFGKEYPEDFELENLQIYRQPYD